MTDATSPFAPLRHMAFTRLWGANFVSSLGTMIQAVGAAWLMTEMTDSIDLVALVQTAVSLPVMLFAVIGGAIADSFDRRQVLLLAQLFMLVMSAVLTGLALLGQVDPWSLLIFTFLIAGGTAVVNPTWHATVGDLVPRAEIPAAVGLHSMGFNLSRSLGPAIGGMVVATAGAAAALLLNCLSFVPVVAALLLWRPRPEAPRTPEPMLGAVLTGIRYVAMSPSLLRVLARNFVFGATAVAAVALLPSVAGRVLGGDAVMFGLLLGAYGAGAVCAAVASSIVRQHVRPETITRMAFVAFAICALLMATGSVWLAGLGLFIGGGSWVFGQTLFNVSVQLSAPRWVVGRAISFFHTATFGGMAVGSWIWGLVAEHFGISLALVAAAAALVLGALLGLVMPMPAAASTDDLVMAGKWQAPTAALALAPDSGPVHIEVAYRIREADRAEFLRVMAERRRIRRRDGAQHWVLLRDIHDPERWVERYCTARWSDYIRHNQRRTTVDAQVHERLLALHAGPHPPAVNRYLGRGPAASGRDSD